jgi:hypothetical protein
MRASSSSREMARARTSRSLRLLNVRTVALLRCVRARLAEARRASGGRDFGDPCRLVRQVNEF